MTDLPPGWAWATLNDILAVEKRPITDGPFGSKLATRHYTSSGARVIRLQNIGDGFFRDEQAYISEDYFNELRDHEVRKGDLLLASLGENLPRVCIAPDLGGHAIVKADCIRARIHSKIDVRWVLYALMAPPTRAWATSRIKGVGRPRLGMAGIRQIPLPIPPLAEQRRIVSILEDYLSRVEDGLESAAKQTQRLNRLRDALRDSASAEGSANKLASDYTSVAYVTKTLGDILSRIEAGKSFRCETRPARCDEWGIIKVSAMTYGEFREEENKAIAPGTEFDASDEIKSGDILLSRANTASHVGASVLIKQCRPRLLLSDKSLRLVPSASVDRHWLAHLLRSSGLRREISRRATGTKDSMRNISQGSLRSIPVKVPSITEQRRIVAVLEDQLASLNRTKIACDLGLGKARSLRQSLLRNAFAGRLVDQDSADEPASVLLGRIRMERVARERAQQSRGQGARETAVQDEALF